MKLGRLIESPQVFALLCVIAVPIVLFRLFGVLFFAGTISKWAVVPALLKRFVLELGRVGHHRLENYL